MQDRSTAAGSFRRACDMAHLVLQPGHLIGLHCGSGVGIADGVTTDFVGSANIRAEQRRGNRKGFGHVVEAASGHTGRCAGIGRKQLSDIDLQVEKIPY